jgi:hypothetical protein
MRAIDRPRFGFSFSVISLSKPEPLPFSCYGNQLVFMATKADGQGDTYRPLREYSCALQYSNSTTAQNIVHLHPVAHCYFTFTFLSVFCAAYRCF